MKGLLLDTHTWLWLQTGIAEKFRPGTLQMVDAQVQEKRVHLSLFSVLEMARLVQEGKFDTGVPVEMFYEHAQSKSSLQLLELTAPILIESTRLPGHFHGDPADRILVATARQHGLTLLTADRQILAYAESGHVQARGL